MAMGCSIGAITSITIEANESPLAPFLSPWAPMVRTPNRYDTFAKLETVFKLATFLIGKFITGRLFSDLAVADCCTLKSILKFSNLQPIDDRDVEKARENRGKDKRISVSIIILTFLGSGTGCLSITTIFFSAKTTKISFALLF